MPMLERLPLSENERSTGGANRPIGMRCRQRVGMPTDQLPPVAFPAKGGRDTQVEWRPLASTGHLGLPVLDFEQCDEVSACVARDLFEPDRRAIAEIR